MTRITVSVAWGLVMGTAFTAGMYGIGALTGHVLSGKELCLAFMSNLMGAAITFHTFYHSK